VFFLLFGSYYYRQPKRRKNRMAKRSVMSEQLKEEIAKELGFYDVVQREGWGGIKARDAGNMVKRAIEMAEQGLAQGKGPQ
jgi:small acid-soluble spore protein F (minor alpha/beta-type SASP)